MSSPSNYSPEIIERIELYALCCPDTHEIRYIGKAKDSQQRLKKHLLDMRRRNYPVYCWMRKLAADDKKPALQVLEVVAPHEWADAERRLIAAYKASGRLLNVADGGDEPHCSAETRAKNGAKAAQARVSTAAKVEAQKLKRRGVTVMKFLKESGQWDGERGLRIRKAMQLLSQVDPRFAVWSVSCEL